MMQDTRSGFELHPITSPVQTERKIDVFKISSKGVRQAADAQNCFPTKKGAGTAGAEHRAAAEISKSERLAMSPLGSNSAQVIAVAGAVNERRSR
jgi:hypothetical protein